MISEAPKGRVRIKAVPEGFVPLDQRIAVDPENISDMRVKIQYLHRTLISFGGKIMEVWHQRLDDAIRIVTAAGDEARRAQAHLVVGHKMDNDYVTQVDQDTERHIRQALLARYPQDGFWGEEYGAVGDEDHLWVLDPIDGTTNYIRGMEEYAVSLAYLCGGQPAVGVVYCPRTGSLYTAIREKGAWKDGQPIRVSADKCLRETVIGMAFAHRNPEFASSIQRMIERLMAQAGDMRRSGSAALDLCRVAEGAYGGYIEPGLNLYDIAAGVLIVQEAGGRISGFPSEAGALQTGNVLASNGLLHRAIESIVADSFQLNRVE